ncbi:MAG TPA: hypothetical protein DCM14_00415 [Clostridiales bacterium UBA8153]|nr:hypothetical protein [Clostridiales bacterium UBA8153]
MLTNNDLVASRQRGNPVEFLEGDARQVLVRARDLIHAGWRLVSHPRVGGLPGPGNPYRSVVVERTHGPVDYQSLVAIEEAIAQLTGRPGRLWSESAQEDLKAMDWWLLASRERAE